MIFLNRILSEFGQNDKILIAATTKFAVDNAFSNLIDLEFFDFLRVGSIIKIKKSILSYVAGHSDKESISELHATLANSDFKEREAISQA
jgi:hypothetical protein